MDETRSSDPSISITEENIDKILNKVMGKGQLTAEDVGISAGSVKVLGFTDDKTCVYVFDMPTKQHRKKKIIELNKKS